MKHYNSIIWAVFATACSVSSFSTIPLAGKSGDVMIRPLKGLDSHNSKATPFFVSDRSTVPSDTRKMQDEEKTKQFHPRSYKAIQAIVTVFLGPFSLTFWPYQACLKWGLPITRKIGNRKSFVSNAHRLGGISALTLPLFLAAFEAITKTHPPIILYALSVLSATANLAFGGTLITRKVPAYDIPTLRAFTVGVLLGFSFLGHSLLFLFGQKAWYKPIGTLFGVVAIYSAIFACSDAFQHAFLFFRSKVNKEYDRNSHAALENDDSTGLGRRHWYLPFVRANWGDVFLKNLWRQPTKEGLMASISPPNGVVCFTTGMTALFALLGMLQLRYFALGPSGMSAFVAAQPAFARWSAYQALLAVVANNFGTFAGTLVIQRRKTQKQAGLYNAIGLMIPVMNILSFCIANRRLAGRFGDLMFLPI